MDTLCSRTGRSQRYPLAEKLAGRLEKACGRNPDVHAAEKSDIGILPKKAANKIGSTNGGVAGGKAGDQGKF